MSRPETDDSSNEGSGTDSEEDQKKMSSETSSGSESENESEANDSRFRMMKNSSDEKRPRDAVAAATALVDSANKRLKTLGGGKPGSDAQVKTPSSNRGVPAAVPKSVTPAVKKGGKPAEAEKKKDVEKEPTPKKTPQAWTTEDEHALVLHIFKDMKSGLRPPKRGSRGENYHYWGDLHEACQGKFSTAWSKEQLYDKYRRMKSRYDGMVEKERGEGVTSLKFKNPGEEKIFNLWKQMYEMEESEAAKTENHNNATSGKKVSTQEVEVTRSLRKSRPVHLLPVRQKGEQENSRPNGGETTGFAVAALELQKKGGGEKFNEVMNGGGASGFSDWLTMSMRNSSPLLGMEMMVPSLFGAGASGWFSGISDVKLRQSWMKQQQEELRVMEQRFRLLQDLCHYQQDVLKKQQQQQQR